MAPDSAKRSDSAIRGGASTTIMRVEVKAEDHMTAKVRPIKIARMSKTRTLSISPKQPVGAPQNRPITCPCHS